MKTPIIDGFSEQGLQSYLKQRQYSGLYWPSLFPVKQVNRLDGKTIIGDQGSRVAAYVISYDSKAPEVSRKAMTTQYFDIPKIAISRGKSEREILEHYIAKSMKGNDPVLEDYYNDIDFVWDGVNARIEHLALSAISKGSYQLTTSVNPLGVINETAIDFGLPAANKKTVAVIWASANLATMTPITDIKEVVKAARAAGTNISRIMMHPDAFDLMIQSTQFLNAAKSLLAGQSLVVGVLGNDVANQIMGNLGLPPITLVNTSVGVENAAGVVTYANPFSTTNVVFVPQVNLGWTYSGPIAEELEKPEGVWQAKRGNILVSMNKEFNPVRVMTKGESNSFISWPSVEQVYNMYTGHTSTWA
jgi:hypothetical protein